MGITYGDLLYCNSVAKGNVEKKISTLDYNNRTVYECFNNHFTYEFGSPYLNLTLITIDDRPLLHKKSHYTPSLLTDAIYVASENYVSTLTTPSDSPDLLPSDYPDTLLVMKKYVPFLGRVHRGYCCRKHDKKDDTKIQGSIDPHALIRTRNFIIIMGFPGLFQRQGLDSWNINILCHNFSFCFCVCLPSILYFTC